MSLLSCYFLTASPSASCIGKLGHFSSSLLTHCISGGRRSVALCKQGKAVSHCAKSTCPFPLNQIISAPMMSCWSLSLDAPVLPFHLTLILSSLLRGGVFSSILLFSDSAQFCHFHCMIYSHPCLAPASPVFLMCPTPFLAVLPWFWP